MASEPEVSEISSLFERLVRNRDVSLFMPFIFGFSNSSPRRDGEDTDQQSENTESTHTERIILINPFTQGMVVIDGASSLETLFREMGSKGGPPPASKESIESMPSVEIKEGEEDGECAVCLEEWKIGEMAKEMPCKHKFHPNCIVKWLEIHGSCPVCRYQMPVDKNDLGKKREEDGGERRRAGGEVWVSFSFHGGINSRNEDSNEVSSVDSGDADSSPRGDDA